eukprot:6829793-Pyramimonas_sp.AAC.1
MSSLLYKGPTYRSPAVALALLTKGRNLDPAQSATQQPRAIARRLLTSPYVPRLLPRARQIWDLMHQQARRGHDARNTKANDGGPFARIKETVDDPGWTLLEFDCFKGAGGHLIHVTRHPDGWRHHVFREDLRRRT